MEFDILYAIQNLHNPVLDNIILVIMQITGDYGHLWIALGVLFLIFRKTRKCGIAILSSYVLVFAVGQFVLKDLIARPRPCHIDETIELLVARPSSFSCPSTHSAWAFAAATSIFCYFKKPGIIAFVFAAFVAFGRMYLFVHFPTDVLLGIAMGVGFAILSWFVIGKISAKIASRRDCRAV